MSDAQREAVRQRALAETALLDSSPEPAFDAIVSLARRLLGTPMASITLVDADREWRKARCGPLAPETPRARALCPMVFETEAPLLVGDARLDSRFAASPCVTGAPNIRYYAGVPVRVRLTDGRAVTIGTLCVLDDQPRAPSAADLEVLAELACAAEALCEARQAAHRATQAAEDRRLTVERLERERRQFKQAERMADMGSWRYDFEQRATTWSDGVFTIHELPVAGGVPNGEILDFFPEPDRTLFLDTVTRTIETGDPFVLDLEFATGRGNRRRVRCMGEIELSQGRPVALIGLIQDITERHCMEQRLLHHARTDDLTQLANRAEFNRVLDKHLAKARATGAQVAVLLIDLDGFKGVNDALGHAAGDEVLRRVGRRLRARYLRDCVPARLGGDEFAVLVPASVGRAALDAMVERLLRNLCIAADRTTRVTGTIGIAWSGEAAFARDELLRRADAALYEAKRTCKGTARAHRTDPGLRLSA